MVEDVMRRHGRIDVPVDNAGWDKGAPFVGSDPVDWDRAVAINLDGVLFADLAGPKLRGAPTRAIPFRRLGRPADVADAVAFPASDEASFITGQTVSVSGGLAMS